MELGWKTGKLRFDCQRGCGQSPGWHDQDDVTMIMITMMPLFFRFFYLEIIGGGRLEATDAVDVLYLQVIRHCAKSRCDDQNVAGD